MHRNKGKKEKANCKRQKNKMKKKIANTFLIPVASFKQTLIQILSQFS